MIRTRQPTGRAPWPLILIEGGEKSGKSWAAATLSASGRVGQTYWLDLGEGAADEYGAIEGSRYLVVEHDGTWESILGQVREIRAEAERAAQAGEPPIVLVIDSMTAEWELLKDWATNRAARSDSNKARLARDPGAEVKVPVNLWNDANTRHRRLMTLLMTFPGIVVMTARGKEVASLDASGKPIEGSREYKVEGHKNLAYDSSVWVRLSRDRAPIVVAARSVHAGVRPGIDEPQELPENWSLEGLIFEALRCDPQGTRARAMTAIQAGAESPDLDDLSPAARRLLAEAEDAANVEQLGLVWTAITAVGQAGEITLPEAELVRRRVQALKAEMNGQGVQAGAA
ncbi:AAA family ATPase [Streptosporangium sp. NPDC020145]|uniref:AAA family ATPase n=1 Tax=Streptosporangium sp. NPDC020145 TaxID=3154694 RepID=UPI0034209818